jgi:poly-beta-1,6-N-acetyl-D-glucosamine N-deacetylase
MRYREIFLATVCALVAASAGAQPATFDVIAYHDVRDRVMQNFDRDQYAISTGNLIDHFQWLEANGFKPISIDDLLQAQRGEKPLPPKAVLLTFDDGLSSLYTRVFPLLKLFHYPAVAAIVTSWIESDATVEQAGRELGRQDFVTWEQIREMQASGLVEIASHSHDLHRGIVANPQGNLEPAAVTRSYGDRGYETDPQYVERIRADLAASVSAIRAHTGRAPRAIAWPFGVYDADLIAAATANGLTITLTLDDSARDRIEDLSVLGRHVFRDNPGVETLGAALLNAPSPGIVRAAQVDLDYVFDPDPARQERNLGLLLDRIKALRISHVFLQAFADPDGDGGAEALYFPNGYLPVRADLFNRVAWQLKTRANVLVYAWLPVLSFKGAAIDPAWRVMQQQGGGVSTDDSAESRLSPFEPQARAIIVDIYRDLARHANFDGLLFHDDARLSDNEDASPAAIDYYRSVLGEDFTIDRARTDPALSAHWASFKSRALVDLTAELAAAVRYYRPAIKTARNIFASSLLDANGPAYLAQRFEEFVGAYDYVALMAMPYLEHAADARTFYEQLVNRVRAVQGGPEHTIFELQTVDWRDGRRVDARELERTMRWLQANGIKHLGYYPDDFVTGEPQLAKLRSGISLAEIPDGTAP